MDLQAKVAELTELLRRSEDENERLRQENESLRKTVKEIKASMREQVREVEDRMQGRMTEQMEKMREEFLVRFGKSGESEGPEIKTKSAKSEEVLGAGVGVMESTPAPKEEQISIKKRIMEGKNLDRDVKVKKEKKHKKKRETIYRMNESRDSLFSSSEERSVSRSSLGTDEGSSEEENVREIHRSVLLREIPRIRKYYIASGRDIGDFF